MQSYTFRHEQKSFKIVFTEGKKINKNDQSYRRLVSFGRCKCHSDTKSTTTVAKYESVTGSGRATKKSVCSKFDVVVTHSRASVFIVPPTQDWTRAKRHRLRGGHGSCSLGICGLNIFIIIVPKSVYVRVLFFIYRPRFFNGQAQKV